LAAPTTDPEVSDDADAQLPRPHSVAERHGAGVDRLLADEGMAPGGTPATTTRRANRRTGRDVVRPAGPRQVARAVPRLPQAPAGGRCPSAPGFSPERPPPTRFPQKRQPPPPCTAATGRPGGPPPTASPTRGSVPVSSGVQPGAPAAHPVPARTPTASTMQRKSEGRPERCPLRSTATDRPGGPPPTASPARGWVPVSSGVQPGAPAAPPLQAHDVMCGERFGQIEHGLLTMKKRSASQSRRTSSSSRCWAIGTGLRVSSRSGRPSGDRSGGSFGQRPALLPCNRKLRDRSLAAGLLVPEGVAKLLKRRKCIGHFRGKVSRHSRRRHRRRRRRPE
jgi:hypothetical protein